VVAILVWVRHVQVVAVADRQRLARRELLPRILLARVAQELTLTILLVHHCLRRQVAAVQAPLIQVQAVHLWAIMVQQQQLALTAVQIRVAVAAAQTALAAYRLLATAVAVLHTSGLSKV
jgi:hypothetical protein